MKSIEKLFESLPEQYSSINLLYINIFKVAMYNAGILRIYQRNFKIKQILESKKTK